MNLDWFNLERLINASSYSDKMKSKTIDRLIAIDGKEDEFSISEYHTIVKGLRDNQLDPVVHCMNYSQTDIINHLNKLK